MKTVLFACIHNAGRSQMAAAWLGALADRSKVRAVSAGTQPGARVHPEVVVAMREVGIDLSREEPQFLSDELAAQASLLVTMGCGEVCPAIPGIRREDWPLEDPKGQSVERVRAIRDEIRRRVEALIAAEGWGGEAAPDILLIGHVTRDLLTPDAQSGYRLGGTVSFAAVTAVKLGRRPTVITCAAPDTDFSELPREVEMHVLPSEATTTFANVYTEAGRIQYSYSQARAIGAADIGPSLRRPRAALLGPIADEIRPDVAHVFAEETLVVATPQGWMRRFDEAGRVHGKPWETASEILPEVDAVVLSLEDIGADLRRLDPLIAQVPLLVLTEYRDGSTLYRRREDGTVLVTRIPPRPAREVDPTGAGDIFATAFVIRLQETRDPVEAARFANITASFGVEAVGVAGIPGRAEVLAYMAEHPFREDADR